MAINEANVIEIETTYNCSEPNVTVSDNTTIALRERMPFIWRSAGLSCNTSV